ncbi:ferredoxin--NADP reductase [Colwellia sp. C1TZA3]|uniref:ferredoxin--NADP reductase n=1 Tax=Colwellia sp. C1TZA3 TaxID=2508879 RepID=UPI0011B9A583|nr:ferredoxin--NADP reductase [Colwellia sp. C1TZA3]TWX73754.1 ferredoxin--NADP reductase [Colwellia sp. C1TZA3]
MMKLDGFAKGEIINYKPWTNNEFSITVKAEIGPYVAGQFTKLALPDENGNWLRRAYSFVNSPNHSPGANVMEFLIIDVPEGNLSPKLAQLHLGDVIYVGDKPSGFMTLDEIPETVTNLWLLATGTAIGPFLSILAEKRTKIRFDNVILVHAVRTQQELVYQALIANLQQAYAGKLSYLPIVSREKNPNIMSGRIPALLKDGSLMQAVKLTPDKQNSFFYLCGNPAMVHDTRDVLLELGFQKHLRRASGNFSFENYW